MIHVVATIELVAGMRDAWLAEQKNLLPLVRAEAGCVEYLPAIDISLTDPPKTPPRDNVVVMLEKWDTIEHLRAHAVAPHLKEFRQRTRQMVQSAKVEVFQPV